MEKQFDYKIPDGVDDITLRNDENYEYNEKCRAKMDIILSRFTSNRLLQYRSSDCMILNSKSNGKTEIIPPKFDFIKMASETLFDVEEGKVVTLNKEFFAAAEIEKELEKGELEALETHSSIKFQLQIKNPELGVTTREDETTDRRNRKKSVNENSQCFEADKRTKRLEERVILEEKNQFKKLIYKKGGVVSTEGCNTNTSVFKTTDDFKENKGQRDRQLRLRNANASLKSWVEPKSHFPYKNDTEKYQTVTGKNSAKGVISELRNIRRKTKLVGN